MLHQNVTKQWCLASNEKALVKQKSVIKDKIKKWKGMESFGAILDRDVHSDLFDSGDIYYVQILSWNWLRHTEEKHAWQKIKQLMN